MSVDNLSPIERSVRNSVICRLHKSGFTVSSIARVMNVGQSVVSRTITKMKDTPRLMDSVLFGEPLE